MIIYHNININITSDFSEKVADTVSVFGALTDSVTHIRPHLSCWLQTNLFINCSQAQLCMKYGVHENPFSFGEMFLSNKSSWLRVSVFIRRRITTLIGQLQIVSLVRSYCSFI